MQKSSQQIQKKLFSTIKSIKNMTSVLSKDIHIEGKINSNSTVEIEGNFTGDINGKRVQSVSGGAHWGGGLWISSLDHARVGQLMLNKGWWDGREIIPKKWVDECLTPCPLSPVYGYLWWLNDAKNGMFPDAPSSAFYAMGVGTQIIYIDPENELVIVARWIEKDKMPGFVNMVLASIEN